MKTISLFFFTFCVAFIAAAHIDSDVFGNRIVGGEDAVEGQFPYQISLRDKWSNQHFCGGSIITDRFMLTAAHCNYRHPDPSGMYVVAGTYRRLEGGVTIALDKITPHKDFDIHANTHSFNDISLLRAAEKIVFTNFIQPIALPTQNIAGDTELVLSGWGRTEYPSDKDLPDNLQFIKTQSLNVDDCQEKLAEADLEDIIGESVLCTISPVDIGACHGDSGGPLVDGTNPENKSLVGVVSWGVPCARGFPDVFTRVYTQLDWIQKNIAAQSKDFE
ncbi:chymotrypsin-2-like [Contarinia nasturtii]|uniref:chymotrypsin-2-like n=1 Tax=Contarinia nasturtii TaxID=265458 RepID=UPI0012D3BEE6|nr:chymotrypsin-2-like [Contarinia nasturtii]